MGNAFHFSLPAQDKFTCTFICWLNAEDEEDETEEFRSRMDVCSFQIKWWSTGHNEGRHPSPMLGVRNEMVKSLQRGKKSSKQICYKCRIKRIQFNVSHFRQQQHQQSKKWSKKNAQTTAFGVWPFSVRMSTCVCECVSYSPFVNVVFCCCCLNQRLKYRPKRKETVKHMHEQEKNLETRFLFYYYFLCLLCYCRHPIRLWTFDRSLVSRSLPLPLPSNISRLVE